MKKPTRTDVTMEKYYKRTKNLLFKFRHEKKMSDYDAIDLRMFVGWLSHKKNEWARATWRQYKSSVIYYLEGQNNPIASEALDILENIESVGCVKKTTKTSGTKLKKFSLKDYQKVCEYLEKSDTRWAIPLKRWIQASLIVGLRPVEWGESQISTVDGETALIVKNAKNTNGRAHGEFRTILLGMLDKEEMTVIKEHVEKSKEWFDAKQYEEYYQGCLTTLNRVCRQLWPVREKHITLYSTRHQFSANAKASGLSKEEVAALMGHAVDETAILHYGRKKAGYDLLKVRPHPSDVQKVKSITNLKPQVEPQPKLIPESKKEGKK